jgi:hypothetical protein
LKKGLTGSFSIGRRRSILALCDPEATARGRLYLIVAEPPRWMIAGPAEVVIVRPHAARRGTMHADKT